MFSDAPNVRKVRMDGNVCLTVNCETIDETQETFNRLKDGGRVNLDPREVFSQNPGIAHGQVRPELVSRLLSGGCKRYKRWATQYVF